MDRVYHFDVLPVHPRPESLESMTSHITRLAETNAISTTAGVTQLLFPNRDRKYVGQLADYPPPALDNYPLIAVCNESQLLAMTFYFLAQRMGRSVRPQAVSRFMAGTVALSLRYCAPCLDEQPYYRLPWRFTAVDGCIEHSCALLDRCQHCKQPVPLCAPPFQLGVCPDCKSRLADCTPPSLNHRVLDSLHSDYASVIFLLSPIADSNLDTPTLLAFVGRRYAHARHARSDTAETVARILRVSLNNIEAIERGDVNLGVKLQVYLAYAQHLGLSLEGIFNDAREDMKDVRDSGNRRTNQLAGLAWIREDLLLSKTHDAVEFLIRHNKRVTWRTVARLTETSARTLSKYARVKTFVEQVTQEDAAPQIVVCAPLESEVLAIVRETINFLWSLDCIVTVSAISDFSGLPVSRLRMYPQVLQLLEESTGFEQNYRRRERHLADKAREALAYFNEIDVPVSVQSLSHAVGVERGSFHTHHEVVEAAKPHVNPVLRRAQRETELVDMVREAKRELEAQGKRITIPAISNLVGMSGGGLNLYPQVRELLKLTVEEERIRRQERKEMLLKRIPEIVRQLETEGQQVTRGSIAGRLGCNYSFLIRIPGARELLDNLGVRGANKRIFQHEDDLVHAVETAVQELLASGECVTVTSIGKTLRLTPEILRRHEIVLTLTAECEAARCRAREEQNQELIRRLQTVADNWNLGTGALTKKALAQVVGVAVNRLSKPPFHLVVQELRRTSQEMHRQARESELLAQVVAQAAILEANGEIISVQKLAVAIGVHQRQLFMYPAVANKMLMFLAAVGTTGHPLRRVDETELLSGVLRVTEELESTGQRVSVCAIAHALSISENTLRYYPRVRVLLQQVRVETRQRKEAQLVADVNRAIQTLEASNQVVSCCAIARAVGRRVESLRGYPQVGTILQEVIAGNRARLRPVEYEADVRAAIEVLLARGEEATPASLEKIIGVELKVLNRDPKVKSIFLELCASHKRKQEEVLVFAVRSAMETLHAQGEKITHHAVAWFLGEKVSRLRNSPQVMTVFRELLEQFQAQKEDELVATAMHAMELMVEQGEPITEHAIAQACGKVSSSALKARYPRIRVVFESLQEEKLKARALREGEIIISIQNAVEELERRGEKRTQVAIAEVVGLSRTTMFSYPRVKDLLKELVLGQIAEREQERETREARLVVQVLEAIEELRGLNKPPTQTAVRRAVGLGMGQLFHYPRIRIIFEQLKKQRPSRYEREEALLPQVRGAIELLTGEGSPPTQTAIARLVGCSTRTLRGYPRVLELLRQSSAPDTGTM